MIGVALDEGEDRLDRALMAVADDRPNRRNVPRPIDSRPAREAGRFEILADVASDIRRRALAEKRHTLLIGKRDGRGTEIVLSSLHRPTLSTVWADGRATASVER